MWCQFLADTVPEKVTGTWLPLSFLQELSLNTWEHVHSLVGHLTISSLWSHVADGVAVLTPFLPD